MEFDIVLKNAKIYDGRGQEPYYSDIAIKDKKIAEIGSPGELKAIKEIELTGKAICPGFIDVHSHADLSIHKKNHNEILKPLICQGITTFVGGNCGIGLAPISKSLSFEALSYIEAMSGEDQSPLINWYNFSGLLEELGKRGVVLNCALHAPHGLIRIAAKGLDNTVASSNEINNMKYLLEEALEAGAIGMSTGLMYFPGLASEENELIELAKLLAAKDAVFASHIRSYSNTIFNAIDELINISEKSGAKVQLSHLFRIPHINAFVDYLSSKLVKKLAQINKYVKLPIPIDQGIREVLVYLENHIQKGIPIGIDAMPTGTGFTHILAFFPPWALEGGKEKILNRISNKQSRNQILKSIQNGKSIWPHRGRNNWSMNYFKIMGFDSIFLMSVITDKNKIYEGKNFVQIGKLRNQSPFDAICDMLIEEDGRVLIFESYTYPGDEFIERGVYAAIINQYVSVVTDTILIGLANQATCFMTAFQNFFLNMLKMKNYFQCKRQYENLHHSLQVN